MNAENQILEKFYGNNAGKIFRAGLTLLLGQFNIEIGEINLIGPTIEGVGMYPQLKDDLSLTGENRIFVAGDSTGIFRGIIPSMMSGIYVALSILKELGKH